MKPLSTLHVFFSSLNHSQDKRSAAEYLPLFQVHSFSSLFDAVECSKKKLTESGYQALEDLLMEFVELIYIWKLPEELEEQFVRYA